ncbi:hypothetical protein GUITHDRAFT_117979 [Guillardia theta CCMP2712]|uniref:PH domain-containing protein n=1 Tax=Guillardia theta (strain CCMP2712) TaxID=905079 RepID=L1IHZ0_GUITC|nr:hypothetical protein GUITHDRAFT_117979 [Guillardia theta CCMP2712]EKX35831.1 hypothetical protein GUITHDRAFT_117979 [Guillardia theta CCMP2712]|eukprot:XP_005822811.1 hypothetical protein GUITHDRAFT_117979 [Guillardia theta CCMP2712]
MTWPRNWGQRHLVLHPHCLICYEDFTARVLRKEKAKMYLSHVCKAFTHDELRFTVCEGSGRQRVWTFQADSEQKKMEWIAAIKTQIEKSNTNNDKSESCQSTQGFGGMEEETYQEISQVSEVLTDISSINVNESLKEHCGDSVTTCSVDVSQTETREKEDIGREGKERGNEQLSSSAGSVGDLRKEAQQEEGERVMSSQPRRRLVRGEINGLIGKRLFEEGLRYWNLYSTRTARSMRAEPESSFSSRPMRLEPPLESKVIVTGEEEEEEEGGGSGSKCGLYMKRSRVYPMDGTRIAKKV